MRPLLPPSSRISAQTEMPLVGRVAELGALRLALDSSIDGAGQCIFLSGESGVGKTRLVHTLAREALQRNVLVAAGAAFAVETGMPYGMISDALVPPLRELPPSTLSVLARGAEHELGTILHGLTPAPAGRQSGAAPEADRKARLLWNFAEFLARWAARQPLLVVLENAQWSDPSSIELVHFVARQLRQSACLIIVTYADDEQEIPTHLRAAERSLVSRDEAATRRLDLLSRHDVADLLHALFALSGDPLRQLADRLHERARGNPLFIDQLIRHLVESGRLWREGERWAVAAFDDLGLPTTIREALGARLGEVEAGARRVAEAAAVIGTRASLPLLQEVSESGATAFADAVDALCARRILREIGEGTIPQYEFVHPLMQLTVLDSISAARKRALHLTAAEAMERALGASALAHATEIARHLVEGHALGGDARALRFVAAAGYDALERHADAEALRLLNDAVAIADRLPPAECDDEIYRPLLENLGRARQRSGDRDGAIAMWQQALARATSAGDDLARGRLLRRLGLSLAFAGRPTEGLQYLDDAEAVAQAGARVDLAIRVRVAKGMLLQSLGRVEDAKAVVNSALPMAEATGDAGLQARVHRALMQLYGWTGPAALARHHGQSALTFATASGDRVLEWWAHWGLAVLEGLGGNSRLVALHTRHADTIAIELRSPLYQVSVAEVAVEYASGVGEWSEGLARAERAIPLARAIAPTTVLPRLLVWTGLILIERDEVARGQEFLQEAWSITCAKEMAASISRGEAPVALEVHNVILAHTGMAALHLSRGEWQQALSYGQGGLAIADRYGYVVWAIHRLLPIILEAALWLQEFELARVVGARFREQSVALGHPLGLAWANASDAMRRRLEDREPGTIPALLAAADELDAIPFPFHAARLRRRTSQLMALEGDVDGARRELHRAHDAFVRLGAERELRGTRSEMRTLGMRLPPRTTTDGAHSLTGRELEIARLLAQHLTNKGIARRLDISARTVSTHLSNMFGKMAVDSRGALVDALRAMPGFNDAGDER